MKTEEEIEQMKNGKRNINRVDFCKENELKLLVFFVSIKQMKK